MLTLTPKSQPPEQVMHLHDLLSKERIDYDDVRPAADKIDPRVSVSERRDVIRRMEREALEEDDRGETLPLNDLL